MAAIGLVYERAHVAKRGVRSEPPDADILLGDEERAGGVVGDAAFGDGAELEAFVEKRFGERFVVRFTGSSLLNASKDETFHKWETVGDQLSGDLDALDEFELESEKAGPVFHLVGRVQF